MLPDPAQVGATVTWTDPLDGVTARSAPVTLAELDLGPLDVVDLVRPDDVQAMTGLDDRMLRYVLTTVHPRPDAELQIQYRQAPAGRYSVFEVGALVRAVRALFTAAGRCARLTWPCRPRPGPTRTTPSSPTARASTGPRRTWTRCSPTWAAS